ncbi:MAG: ABC transporter permease, partial [Bacteroidales bacterium]|nr:ABC transporter permease [Bacteroidales bacterium]
IGLFVGGLISYLQQEYGFISLGNGGTGFVVDAYPVKLIFYDFIKVFSLVVIMSGFSVIYPLRQLSKQL